jgi:hypothetical protein
MTGRVKVRPEVKAMLDPVASPKGTKRAMHAGISPGDRLLWSQKKRQIRISLFHSEDRCAAA